MNSPTSMPVGELSAEVRGSFLVRVYSHLALAILLFVGIEVWMFQSGKTRGQCSFSYKSCLRAFDLSEV